MLYLAKITSLSTDDEVCAIVLSKNSELTSKEVHKICARLFDIKVSNIKQHEDCWTLVLGDKYDAQLELTEYPLINLC